MRGDGRGGLLWEPGTRSGGTQERKCSRECDLLKGNERNARGHVSLQGGR